MKIAFPEREGEEPGTQQRTVALSRLGREFLMNLTRTSPITRRLAIAALLWASLALPVSLDAHAQDSTPRATLEHATPMTMATPMRMATPEATYATPTP